MPTNRLPYLSILYWVIPLVATSIVWDSLPRLATQLSLISAAVIIGLAATLRQVSYPIIGTPFFILLIASYYQSFLLVDPLIISALVLVALPLSSVYLYRIAGRPISRADATEWVFLAFLTAQVNSLLLFWPFSFFENALVSFIAYYGLWQLIRILEAPKRRSLIAHFVFTCLAVIVVIGVIIWANFPQYRTF
jgi:hypothetical protein